jgi:hypothetical protein
MERARETRDGARSKQTTDGLVSRMSVFANIWGLDLWTVVDRVAAYILLKSQRKYGQLGLMRPCFICVHAIRSCTYRLS